MNFNYENRFGPEDGSGESWRNHDTGQSPCGPRESRTPLKHRDVANLVVARIREALQYCRDHGHAASQAAGVKVIAEWALKTQLKNPIEPKENPHGQA